MEDFYLSYGQSLEDFHVRVGRISEVTHAHLHMCTTLCTDHRQNATGVEFLCSRLLPLLPVYEMEEAVLATMLQGMVNFLDEVELAGNVFSCGILILILIRLAPFSLFWHLLGACVIFDRLGSDSRRAGHLRYFLIFSIMKSDIFCIFYHVN